MYFLNKVIGLIKACFTGKIYIDGFIASADKSEIDKKTKIIKPYKIHHATIKLGTYVSTNSRVSFTEIGKFCSIGPNFFCGYGIHPINGISTSPVFYSTQMQAGFSYSKNDKIEERKKITIGNDVFIGANVTVLDGVTIGNGAIIGAGAVVSKDIPPYAIAVGTPIKIIKYRFEPEIIEKLQKIEWWNKDEKVLKSVEKYFFEVNKFIELLENYENG
ncbi:CatB-related O-acetyltransferase [Segetibacter koreensis]|uniref:CatB-related O-acetyltransferase n=1 Tax=Segetibacter koreensis TaxID=398037 RepID=UPI00037E24B8|nr:CatB-related O-acetyltransferase [Segetibacter koreensis]